MNSMTVNQRAITETYARIKPHVRRTPVIDIDAAELGLAAGPLTLKLELLQHAGSFKARGAFANLTGQAVPAAGVAAASGGNHGAAVAFAAQKLGHPAHIFVPTISSPAKIERIRSYGADLVIEGSRYAEALERCQAFIARTGALSVHAYDAPLTLLGQGTVGLEFEEQAPNLDTLLVAVGGGGLIGGIAAWYQGRVKVVGVEPADGADAACRTGGRIAGGRCRERPGGGFSRRQPHRRHRIRHRARACGPVSACARRCHSQGPACSVGPAEDRYGAGRRGRARRADDGGLHASTRRARWAS